MDRGGCGFTDGQVRGCRHLPEPLSSLPHTLQDPEDHQRLKKKQKNRAAAQRSRQKHTDKADALHQVRDAFCSLP